MKLTWWTIEFAKASDIDRLNAGIGQIVLGDCALAVLHLVVVLLQLKAISASGLIVERLLATCTARRAALETAISGILTDVYSLQIGRVTAVDLDGLAFVARVHEHAPDRTHARAHKTADRTGGRVRWMRRRAVALVIHVA